MIRDFTDPVKLQAHHVLDLARAGQDISAERIQWALTILGDYTGE